VQSGITRLLRWFFEKIPLPYALLTYSVIIIINIFSAFGNSLQKI
jgi:hypothetical protein